MGHLQQLVLPVSSMRTGESNQAVQERVGVTSLEIPMLRSSERASFKRCPQLWQFGAVEGLTPVNQDTGPRWFGTGQHLAMAEFYIPGRKRGRDPIETWQEYTKGTYNTVKMTPEWNSEAKAEFIDARKLGREMIKFYLEITSGDPHWEVIAPEQRFQVYIPDPRNPKRPIVLYVGTFDLVIRDLNTGIIYIVDHKTINHLPGAGELAVLDLDDQAGPYLSLATHFLRQKGLIGPKETVRGMIYNFLVKRTKDERPTNEHGQYLNKNGSVSKIQPPDPFLRHEVIRTAPARKRQLQRVQDDAMWMEAVRKGDLPITKNVTKECRWCDFFELCRVDENGGDVEYVKRMAFKKRDIYADHREGADNSKTSVANKRKTGVQ